MAARRQTGDDRSHRLALAVEVIAGYVLQQLVVGGGQLLEGDPAGQSPSNGGCRGVGHGHYSHAMCRRSS